MLAYSAFFYHYADFVAPSRRPSVGCAAGTLCRAFSDRPEPRRSLIAAAAVLVLGLAVFQARELSGLYTTSIYPDKAVIPAPSRVVTDEVSLTLAANRFSTRPGCPDALDSLATTLVEDNGIPVEGGAKASARAVSGVDVDLRPRPVRVAVERQRPAHPVDPRARRRLVRRPPQAV